MGHESGTTVEGQPHVVAEGVFHGLDTGDGMLHALFGHQPTVGMAAGGAFFANEIVGYVVHHVAMERNGLFDDAKAFFGFGHLYYVFGIGLGRLIAQWEAYGAVVDAHFVAHFATEELVDG